MGVNLSALRHVDELMSSRSRPNGLWGVSPLYVNPVNGLITLTKVRAEGKGVPVREGLKEARVQSYESRPD